MWSQSWHKMAAALDTATLNMLHKHSLDMFVSYYRSTPLQLKLNNKEPEWTIFKPQIWSRQMNLRCFFNSWPAVSVLSLNFTTRNDLNTFSQLRWCFLSVSSKGTLKALSAAAPSSFRCRTRCCPRREPVSAGRRGEERDHAFWCGVSDRPKASRDLYFTCRRVSCLFYDRRPVSTGRASGFQVNIINVSGTCYWSIDHGTHPDISRVQFQQVNHSV